MRKIYLLVLLLASSLVGFGQYYYIPPVNPGNPGGLNNEDAEFPLGSGLPATWTTLLGPSNATPVWSPAATIPFAFNFNGNPVTQYKVSSSGVLTFTTGATAVPGYTNAALPNAGIPDASVLIWGIAGTGGNDNIVTQTFGTAPNRQHWVFFTSYTAGSWSYWSIVLEEGTNDIYIVDMRHSTSATVAVTAGIQINGTSATSVTGSPSLANLAGASSADDDNYAYRFVFGTQPAYDMSAIGTTVPNFLITGQAPFTMDADFSNLGTATINTFDFNYRVDGGTTVTNAVSPAAIAPLNSANVASPQTWTPAAAGTYSIDIWASNLNGNADLNMGNDTFSFDVTVVDTFLQRRAFFETYTSSTCPPCVPANQNLEGLFNDPINADKVTSLKFQMSWPGNGDPYYTAEAGVRRSYYSISSIPRVEIDGGYDQNGNNVTQNDLDDAYNIPSFVGLDAEFVRSGPNGETIDVDVDINPIADISSNDLVLYVAIFEYETVNNVGSNGETEFAHVMKKMLPDENGTLIAPLVNGVPVSQNTSWTFNGSYRLPADANSPINHGTEHSVEQFSDLGVAVWLQDINTKEVFQSGYGVDMTMVAVEESMEDGLHAIAYPNPTNGKVNLAVTTAELSDLHLVVRNALGQAVIVRDLEGVASGKHIYPLDISGFEGGLYFYEVKAGESVTSGKVLLSK